MRHSFAVCLCLTALTAMVVFWSMRSERVTISTPVVNSNRTTNTTNTTNRTSNRTTNTTNRTWSGKAVKLDDKYLEPSPLDGFPVDNLTTIDYKHLEPMPHFCAHKLGLSLSPTRMPAIIAVYFVFLHGEKSSKSQLSRNIYLRQLHDMFLSGFMRATERIYVVLTGLEETPLLWGVDQIRRLPSWAQDKITVRVAPIGNRWEFPGIHLLWSVACTRPDALFLYFHSKGNTKRYTTRNPMESMLMYDIIVGWRGVLALFDHFPNMTTAGPYVASQGWYPTNFFWAKGSLLVNLTEPVFTLDRYYYELWLGLRGYNHCPIEPRNSTLVDTFGNRTWDRRGPEVPYKQGYSLLNCDFTTAPVERMHDRGLELNPVAFSKYFSDNFTRYQWGPKRQVFFIGNPP